jgi:hypothetical protein
MNVHRVVNTGKVKTLLPEYYTSTISVVDVKLIDNDTFRIVSVE